MGRVRVYFDGSSRGNPGPSGAGVVIVDENGKVLFSGNRFLGVKTNNEAEYYALLMALEISRDLGYKDITLCTDSILVFSQLTGRYKVRSENLKGLFKRVKLVLKYFNWDIKWVPRSENRMADKLAQNASAIGGTEYERSREEG